MLKKIVSEDLLFTNEIEDDRTNTYVQLNDYDWMNYIIKTCFKTTELGILDVSFEYFGATFSHMEVVQTIDEKKKEYTYEYSTDIFEKYIKQFLLNHIDAWSSRYAFNGEEIVIDFYNEVLEVGVLREVDKDVAWYGNQEVLMPAT